VSSESQRNLLIILAIGIVVTILSAGSALFTIERLISIIFTIVILWAMWSWHQRNQDRIATMPNLPRIVFYFGAIGGLAVMFTGLGVPGWASWGASYALVFFALLAGCIYGAWWAWQRKAW
jgi:hypothetical protein